MNIRYEAKTDVLNFTKQNLGGKTVLIAKGV